MIAGLSGVGPGGGGFELRGARRVAEALTWSRRPPTEGRWMSAADEAELPATDPRRGVRM